MEGEKGEGTAQVYKDSTGRTFQLYGILRCFPEDCLKCVVLIFSTAGTMVSFLKNRLASDAWWLLGTLNRLYLPRPHQERETKQEFELGEFHIRNN